MENKISTCSNPLLNVHVLEIVFGNCNRKTILQCRLVCQIWNSEALRTIEKNGVTAQVKGSLGISNFLSCLKSSNDDPFSSFSIELPQQQPSDTGLEETCDLINLLKDRMKQVKFEYELPKLMPTPTEGNQFETTEYNPADFFDYYSELPKSNLNHIVLPVLSSLQLFSTNIFPPVSPTRLPRFFDMVKTPSLTSLSVQHLYPTECSATVINLIKSSKLPLLYLRMPCTQFPKIVGHVNLSQLNELDICDLFHGSFATIETITKIAENCCNLNILTIEIGCRVTFDAIFKLFEVLAHSLTQLKLIIQDKNLLSRNIQQTNFFFPHMPRLSNLFLRFANPGLIYYIDGMPRLKSLELELPWTRKVRGQLFPGLNNRVYEGIKTFNVSEKLTTEDVQNMYRFFPNLKKLSAPFKSDEALFQLYIKFPNLQDLIIDRNSEVSDFGIVGIMTKDELNGITDMHMVLPEEIHSPIVSSKPCIAALKKLRCLKLVQVGLSWKCLVFGISELKELRSLTIQATSLKIEKADLTKDPRILNLLEERLSKLQNLCVWIRRNADRLSAEEMELLTSKYPQWEIDVTIQTICNTT